MAEVIPRKRQAELERFHNRLAGYKRHSQECVKKFQPTFEAIVEHDTDQTLYLKQKFLQSKEKRAAKKKLDPPNNTVSLQQEHKEQKEQKELKELQEQLKEQKEQQKEYVDLADLQLVFHKDAPFELNDDAIKALMSEMSESDISDIISGPKDSKDNVFSGHPQTSQQPQMLHDSHHAHHHHQPHQRTVSHQTSFHQSQIKIEDVKANTLKTPNALPNQHIPFHMQQPQPHHMMHQHGQPQHGTQMMNSPSPRMAFNNGSFNAAAQTLKQMAEQHNKQNFDCIKQEAVYSSNSNSPIGYSPGAAIPEKTQPRQRNTTPTFKQQPYSPYDSPNHGSPQYPPRCGPGAGPSPVSPKTPAAGVQIKQNTQVHMNQTAGQQIQVTMAQNVTNDMNTSSVSMAGPHQTMYYVNQNTPACNVKIEPNQNFINVSQQQHRHHNANASTNNATHHTTDGPIGDQHKLTQQQLQQHQHLMRAQQVSMAQNVSADMNPPSVSVAAQPGMYYVNQNANGCNVKMEPNQNFINVSQTQNINFNQQIRHHVVTSTANTPMHEVQIADQHKMTQQQMQHQHMLRAQQLFKQQQQQQQQKQQQSHHAAQMQQHQPQHPQHHQQHQQQQMQQQLRLQQMPSQKPLQSMIRPPPPEYNMNGRQTSGQFQGMPCNMPQRLPQQNTFPGNVPVHNNAMNMMPGHMQQMPIRSLPNPKQQKPTMNMQHSNYPMSLNLPMLHGMNNGAANSASSVSSQTYSQQRPNNAMPLPNMSHMANNMTNLHHNPHRSQEIPSNMQNTNVNAMNNCNTNVSSMQDFSLDFLDQQFTSNELLFNLSDLI